MKPIVFLLMCVHFSISAQELRGKEKRFVRNELKEMLKQDQLYRSAMQGEASSDSLWALQTRIDEENKTRLLLLIERYGFPSAERNGGNETALILLLHLTHEHHLNELEDVFRSELNKGHLPAEHFAIWYDRCQLNMERESYYGAYGLRKINDDKLIQINAHRAEIGLGPVQINRE